MDDFKTMAEVKMRESIEAKMQRKLMLMKQDLQTAAEFENLQTQDSRVESANLGYSDWARNSDPTTTDGVDPSALGIDLVL